jgi:hypothetical protein
VPTPTHMNNNNPALFAIPAILLLLLLLSFSSYSPSVTMAQQQQQQTTTTTTTGTGAPPTLPATTPSLAPIPPLTPQEQEQQIRLQNVIAATTANLQETQKQISGVVFTPRWSEPVWINANSLSVLIAYCLPGEFADSGQEILGGFELEVLESYAVALPQNFMAWMAVVGNEDIQNTRFPAALGVICASDLNKPETRVLSPEKQQQINNINQQFVNIQNTQITDIDNVINIINNLTANETATEPVTPPSPPTNDTIEDTTPPVIDGPEDYTFTTTADSPTDVIRGGWNILAEDNVDGTALYYSNGYVEQDDVGGDISIECNPNVDYWFPVGSTTVECTATDEAGNVATHSWTLTFQLECPIGTFFNATSRQCESIFPDVIGNATIVEDTTPPVIYGGYSQTIGHDNPNGRQYSYDLSVQDNVDGHAVLTRLNELIQVDDFGGDILIECNPPPGSLFPIGTTTVQCTAVDQAGNEATHSFTITIVLEVEPLPPGEIPTVPREQPEEVPPPPSAPPTEPQPEPEPEPEPEPGPPPQEEEQGEEGGGGGTDAESPSE